MDHLQIYRSILSEFFCIGGRLGRFLTLGNLLRLSQTHLRRAASPKSPCAQDVARSLPDKRAWPGFGRRVNLQSMPQKLRARDFPRLLHRHLEVDLAARPSLRWQTLKRNPTLQEVLPITSALARQVMPLCNEVIELRVYFFCIDGESMQWETISVAETPEVSIPRNVLFPNE